MQNTFNQYPFFEKVKLELSSGVREKRSFRDKEGWCHEVTCPKCRKRKSVLLEDTFMFLCPITGCIGGLNLHQLITQYCSDDLINEWNRSIREQKRINDASRNGFEKPMPIKNRRPRGSNKPPLSDLERLRIKAMIIRGTDPTNNRNSDL